MERTSAQETMKNPHSPTKAWLNSVASDESGYVTADVGDSGEITLEHGDETFKVTVEKIESEETINE